MTIHEEWQLGTLTTMMQISILTRKLFQGSIVFVSHLIQIVL